MPDTLKGFRPDHWLRNCFIAREGWWTRPSGWRGLAVILPVVLAIHLFAAATTIRHSNQDPAKSDQGAMMWLAETSREDFLPQRTDGVRNPLWAWIARYFYTDNDKEFFARGKWFNTALCAAFLCALGVGVARWLEPLATANLLLLSSLGILVVRGTYFQPEPLYYMLLVGAILLACRLLRGAPLTLWALFGVVCGMAHLSKPSMEPFLAVFIASSALLLTLTWREPGSWKTLGGLVLALGIFGVMMIPLARFSQEAFGKPLFNYTKYFLWMDDFDTEALPFQNKYPGRVQLETLPPEETPSPSWYFRHHTAGDALTRLVAGTTEVGVRFLFPETKVSGGAFFWRASDEKWEQPLAHRGIYLIVLTALCAGLLWPTRHIVLKLAKEPGNLTFGVFLFLMAGLYLALYGWYYPIGRGDRFMGSLWIPAVFLLCWWTHSLRRMISNPWKNAAYFALHLGILLSLLLQILGIFWRFQHGFYMVTRN